MQIGTQLGPYRIDALIGRGGMAEVFKVYNGDLGRFEALKALPSALAADRSLVERFLREARTAAALQHPNIAIVYGVSDASAAQPYFTMELIEGGDLADLIEARGRLPLIEALPLLRQIADALDYAHGRGLIHRDIKPANLMLEAKIGQIKVVDFGIARAQEENGNTRLTSAGMIVGTPAYMSPEQAGSGAPIDRRSDLYSLSIIAYELLCGAPPFQESSQTSLIMVLMRHVRDAPRAPVELAPHLSKAANAAIMRALAKNPDERFASCGEFINALEASTPVAVPAYQAARPARSRSFPLVPVALGVVLLAGAGLVGWSVSNARGNGEIEYVAPVVAAPTAATSADTLIAEAPTPEIAAPVQISVPQVVGKTEAQAREILKANGLAADVTTGRSAAFDAQQVMGQSPPPGALISSGAPVRIRISLGAAEAPKPRRVRRPDPEPSTEGDAPMESRSSNESNGGYSLSGPEWPGELFPQVRLRYLDQSEVDPMRYAKVRYAINEAYARHGLTFRDRFIQAVFDKKPWYNGDRSRTTAQIDAEFNDIERANVRMLSISKQGKTDDD